MESLEIQFFNFVHEETQRIKNGYNASKTSPNAKKLKVAYLSKYPFLRIKKEDRRFPYLDEVIEWSSTKALFDNSQIESIIKVLIAKITGIYKHGQTDKTLLCNLRMVSNVRHGKLTIAISKNTLDAKKQWEARLISDLKKEFPRTPLRDLILIISSDKNDLDGNATHCKNVNEAISEYTRGNFKIIFVCSNNARAIDILVFLSSYRGFSIEKQVPIEIQHDEAHNSEEGIPSKRHLIENILMNPFVKAYIPISASNHPIYDEERVLWKKHNLEMYAIDYTYSSQTKSTSPEYSSISDALQLTYDELRHDAGYTEYGIVEIDEETFDEADEPGKYVGWDPEEAKADKKRRRQLEFCPFMAYEKEAVNLGMNFLDNFYISEYEESDGTTIETPIILHGEKNIHILITPCRVAVTLHLIKHAIKQSYNPICIGLYRSEIHLRYKNRIGQIIRKKFGEIDDSCSSEQMNAKIFEILEYVKRHGDSIERPILIMGNYKPTGESITFVNYQYGTVRSVMLLPAICQTREANYQGYLRCCYMDRKFKEADPLFVHPPKWLIGSQNAIDDALEYEQENDDRIDSMLEGTHGAANTLLPLVERNNTVDENYNVSAPCKIQVFDSTDPLFVEFHKILGKSQRSVDDKKRILQILKQLIEEKTAEFKDPTGKFNWDTYTLKDVRSWKTNNQESLEEKNKRAADYRFREYDAKHTLGSSYMNNKGTMKKDECELLSAYDKYVYEGFINHTTIIWLSYKFG
jgi:hypothetical protein